jgi:hypothetical protein
MGLGVEFEDAGFVGAVGIELNFEGGEGSHDVEKRQMEGMADGGNEKNGKGGCVSV